MIGRARCSVVMRAEYRELRGDAEFMLSADSRVFLKLRNHAGKVVRRGNSWGGHELPSETVGLTGSLILQLDGLVEPRFHQK